MQFNSYAYVLLLLPAVAVFWALSPSLRRWYVLALSIAFYASWRPFFVLVPLMLALGVHFSARNLASRATAPPSATSRWLRVGIAFVLVIFLFFRYRQFLFTNLNALLGAFGAAPLDMTLQLAVPLGISFYSFEAIAYLIDTKQGRIKNRQFFDLYLFLMFWPNLLSGPIARFRELGQQISFAKPFDPAMLLRGLDRLVWGLVIKNVIANSLGSWVDDGFLPRAVSANTTIDNWALAVAYGLQVYFDFAAYSNMAIGVAQLLGVVLPENFRFPYHARTPAEFWNRWHMTLSRWIRDYLFFPVNARFRGAPLPLYLSLIGIMALVGLWHGPGWGFIAWGAMHGVYLVLYRIWERLGERPRFSGLVKSRASALAWQVFTLAAVAAAWIPFRAATGHDAAVMLASMFGRIRLGVSYSVNFYLVVLLVALFCAVEPLLASAWKSAEERITACRGGLPLYSYLIRPAVYGFGLMLFFAFDDRSMQFIYFHF
jgi:alginate O-acetyltransferase complex protein AlgI